MKIDLASLKQRLVYEAKELAQTKFEDLPSEDDWLMMGPSLEPYEA